jgi:hypothetical protein
VEIGLLLEAAGIGVNGGGRLQEAVHVEIAQGLADANAGEVGPGGGEALAGAGVERQDCRMPTGLVAQEGDDFAACQLSPSPRWRGEGRGEGRFLELAEPLENPVEVVDDLVFPDADHAVTKCRQHPVALSVVWAFRVLAAIELDDQAPLTTDKINVVAIDRLLANEFEAAKSASANVGPQREFRRGECSPQ